MKAPWGVAVGFGENLRRCRRRAGLSQEELSFRACVHRVAVGKMERGESLPRTDTLLRLAGGLGVEAQELLDGLVWTPPEAAPQPWGSFEIASSRPASGAGNSAGRQEAAR